MRFRELCDLLGVRKRWVEPNRNKRRSELSDLMEGDEKLARPLDEWRRKGRDGWKKRGDPLGRPYAFLGQSSVVLSANSAASARETVVNPPTEAAIP
jgi:hypothetical protein